MSQETELLKASITSLKATRDQTESDLAFRKKQAEGLLRKTAADLLIAIREDPTVLATNLKITRSKSKKTVVFEITFPEDQIIGRPDFTDAVKDFKDLSEAAGVDQVYMEEK